MCAAEPSTHPPAGRGYTLAVRGQTLTLGGEIDLASADHVHAALQFLLETPDADVFVDTSAVTFIDLAGLEPILTVVDRLIPGSGHVTISPVGQPVRRLMHVLERVNPGVLDTFAAVASSRADVDTSLMKAAGAVLRAGTERNVRSRVHAIDGDGCSMCEAIEAAHLEALEDLSWKQIRPDDRCSLCVVVLGSHV